MNAVVKPLPTQDFKVRDMALAELGRKQMHRSISIRAGQRLQRDLFRSHHIVGEQHSEMGFPFLDQRDGLFRAFGDQQPVLPPIAELHAPQ